MTLPGREAVGAVYDRAFSCRTEDQVQKRAVIDRAYSPPPSNSSTDG